MAQFRPAMLTPDECVDRLAVGAAPVKIALQRILLNAEPGADDEEQLIQRWTPRRKAEFRTGRTSARRLLATLGAHPSSIPFDEGGAPIWPAGFVGSISHKRGFCLVAAARAQDVASVGIDLERDLESSVLAVEIVSDGDRLQLLGSVCLAPHALLLAAKEAVYKCDYQRRHIVLGWRDVAITFAPAAFTARIGGVDQLQIAGAFACKDGWLTTLAVEMPVTSGPMDGVAAAV